MKRPTPVNIESPFSFEELFFSTTNKSGVILFGNDVFVRVSKYSRETIVGAPHSLIRHPDMPRAVFKLLWDTIKNGQPIMAYVKNLASDGSFYWVQAFVFPIAEGYLSIRIKPSSALWEAAKAIYSDVLAVEAEGGLEASSPLLLEQIKKAGFSTYTDFMIQAAFAELKVLQAKRSSQEVSLSTKTAREISQISAEAAAELKDCADRIQAFQVSNQAFVQVMNQLNDGFQHLKYIALNMTISAAKFGQGIASLGVVAKEFSGVATQIQDHLSGLARFMNVLNEVIQKCALRISSLEVQMLMVDFFIRESLTKSTHSENGFSDMVSNRVSFSTLFREYAEALDREMGSLKAHLSSVSGEMAEIRKFTTGLEVIRQMGAVESSREAEVRQTFTHYLEEMKKFINLLQNSTGMIHKEISEMEVSSGAIAKIAHNLAGKVDAIFNLSASSQVAS